MKRFGFWVPVFSVFFVAACDGDNSNSVSVDPVAEVSSSVEAFTSSSSVEQVEMDDSSFSIHTVSEKEYFSSSENEASSSSLEKKSSSSLEKKSSSSLENKSSSSSAEKPAKLSSSSFDERSSGGMRVNILPNTVDSCMRVPVVPCKTDSTDTCEYGTLTDERDGQTYKTVKIGGLWWMAENLNYAYLLPTDTLDSSSFCYNDSLEYCEKYGRLYTWFAALKVCPSGWHLPWYLEYETLVPHSFGDGRVLRSTEWNGTDDYGFSALPAGARYADGKYTLGDVGGWVGGMGGYTGDPAWFWTDTKIADQTYGGVTYKLAHAIRVFPEGNAGLSTGRVEEAYSVRCVKDH